MLYYEKEKYYTVIMEGALSMKKRVIIIIVAVLLVIGIGGVCAGFAWKDYNRYEVKKGKIIIELGEGISGNPADYIEAGEKALEETRLDTSKVDNMTVGTYTIYATWKKHIAYIKVVVKDTVAPEITLKDTKDFRVMVGQEVKATDLVTGVIDLAGIKSVSFESNQIELISDSENPLDKIGLKFDIAGEQTVKFIAEDNNGNQTVKEVTVKVIEDYLTHVSGFHDITMEQGTKPDWMDGIVADDKIAGITVDESAVDINTPGEYQLKYIITGNDNETVVEQTVKVTVTEKVVVTSTNNSSLSSNGNSSSSSSSGNRPSGNRNSGSSSTGGSSRTNGSSTGSSNNSTGDEAYDAFLDSLSEGETYISEDEGGGYIDGENGNTATSGTW